MPKEKIDDVDRGIKGEVKETLEELEHRAKATGRKSWSSIKRFSEKHPFQAAGIALAMGITLRKILKHRP